MARDAAAGNPSPDGAGGPAFHNPTGRSAPAHQRFENVVGDAGGADARTTSSWHGLAGAGAPSAAEDSLASALRASVATLGQAGPPPGGLLRIQRKARARQRNRAVLAGSAGVLVLAVAVSMATGARFDLVPTLTGESGASGGTAAGNPSGVNGSTHASAAANGDHAVWPTGSPGKTGLAIGPVAPVVTTPSAAAATQLPLCTATSLKADTTVGVTISNIVYGHVDAVAQSPCVVVGPPVLTVANQAGTASSSVHIVKESVAAAPQLPSVPTWGRTMVLKAGQGYQFQFAWDAAPCAQGAAASPSSSGVPSVSSMYYLGYAITGTMPTAVVTLNAPCGAQVYVTDIYDPGAFPLPKAPSPPPPAVSTSAAPPSSPAPPPVSPPAVPSTAPSSESPASPSPSESSSDPNTGVSIQATTPVN